MGKFALKLFIFIAKNIPIFGNSAILMGVGIFDSIGTGTGTKKPEPEVPVNLITGIGTDFGFFTLSSGPVAFPIPYNPILEET